MRRSRLPRIQLKALEEPDFAEIGRNNAAQDGQRGRRSGWGGSLYTSRAKEPLPCAPMPTSGRIRASRVAPGRRVRLTVTLPELAGPHGDDGRTPYTFACAGPGGRVRLNVTLPALTGDHGDVKRGSFDALDGGAVLAASRPHGPRLPTFSVLRYLGRHVPATKIPEFPSPKQGIPVT